MMAAPMRCSTGRRASAQKEVEAFNRRHRVGDTVLYHAWPGAAPILDRVFAPAEVLNGHTAVAWLAGQRGCVACEHIQPIESVEAET